MAELPRPDTPNHPTVPPGWTSLGFLISASFRLMRQVFSRTIAGHGLTPPQHGVLQMLDDEPDLTLAEMARRAVADTPTLSRIVDRLERRGLVQRAPAEEDRRCLMLQLSSSGRRLARLTRQLSSEVEGRLLTGFTAEETRSLQRLLQRLLRNAMTLCANDQDPHP